MFGFFKKNFSKGGDVDFSALMQMGSQIVDVRTPEEFQNGHIEGSVNIPVQNLSNRIAEIHKGKPVIVCCATGIRSATAKTILMAGGHTQVHNAGGWRALKDMLQNSP